MPEKTQKRKARVTRQDDVLLSAEMKLDIPLTGDKPNNSQEIEGNAPGKRISGKRRSLSTRKKNENLEKNLETLHKFASVLRELDMDTETIYPHNAGKIAQRSQENEYLAIPENLSSRNAAAKAVKPERSAASAAKKLERDGFVVTGDKILTLNRKPPSATGIGSPAVSVKAPEISERNFASQTAKLLWQKINETERNDLLINFNCSFCMIKETLGIPIADIIKMNTKSLREATVRAVEKQKAAGTGPCLTQPQNIMISFEKSDNPGELQDRHALMITGDCQRCGCPITRTLLGEAGDKISIIGAMLLLQEKMSLKKPGRNDPCPCGSGKKHKMCCGRQKTE